MSRKNSENPANPANPRRSPGVTKVGHRDCLRVPHSENSLSEETFSSFLLKHFQIEQDQRPWVALTWYRKLWPWKCTECKSISLPIPIRYQLTSSPTCIVRPCRFPNILPLIAGEAHDFYITFPDILNQLLFHRKNDFRPRNRIFSEVIGVTSGQMREMDTLRSIMSHCFSSHIASKALILILSLFKRE